MKAPAYTLKKINKKKKNQCLRTFQFGNAVESKNKTI